MTATHTLLAVSNSGGYFILLIGIAIFFGSVGAKIFQKLNFPQIIGYLAIGIILGPLLKIISPETLQSMEPINTFALGIIGFLIGSELKGDVFRRFGKQVVAILIFEGLTAFVLVTSLAFIVMINFYNWQTSAAVAIVLGAICAATDPASTTSVLWEYKSRGPLTTMLTAIVALDDALALMLYIASVSIAGFITGHQQSGVAKMMLVSVYEIIGSLILGFLAALLLNWIIKRVREIEKILIFSIGLIILTIGVAKRIHLDVILASMSLGATLINLSPRQSIKSFDLIRKFSPPVYVLFFVLIGARLNVSAINLQILLLATVYIVGSIIGKTAGSYWGASYSNAYGSIKKYLGFCLYQQGTIAIALLIMASTRFEGQVKETMLTVIIIGVFVLQLIGPILVKYSIKKAGEAGMNITENDLIISYKVSDVMDTKAPLIPIGLSLNEVITLVSTTDNFYYPVVDNNKVTGVITLDGIRNTFTIQQINDWLVALDITEPIVKEITPQMPLADAFDLANRLNLEFMPVIDSTENKNFMGLFDTKAIRRSLSAEILSRQQKADSLG